MPATPLSAPAPALHVVPDPDDGLALRYFDVVSGDGTRLRAWTNDADGPTVLLCNGLGTNPHAWPMLLDPDCGVRVVSWNHRGTGGSERPGARHHVGIEAFVEDAVAVLDHLEIDACPVMGWSMGVNTAFELATLHPDRVTGLFAVAGVPGGTFSSMLAPLRVPRLARAPITVNAARLMGALGKPISAVLQRVEVGPKTIAALTHSGFMLPVPDPEAARRAIAEFVTTPVEWYMHLAVTTSRHVRVSLRDLAMPATFVAGRWDVLASAEDMRTAAERMADAEYVVYPASHFIGLEHPEEVLEHLHGLLDRIG